MKIALYYYKLKGILNKYYTKKNIQQCLMCLKDH